MVHCKKYLVLLLALIYLGQATVVSALPCRSMPIDMGMVENVEPSWADVAGGHQMAAHSHHHASVEAAADSATGDCCDDGLCTMSQCHASPALPSSVAIHATHAIETHAGPGRPSSPIHPSYALFKPPIFL